MISELTTDLDAVSDAYGNFGWSYDGAESVDINDLHDEIIAVWENCVANDDFSEAEDNGFSPNYYLQFDGETIFDSFNPRNIVDSAEAYDCDLVVWLYSYILEPKEIYAITTKDGTVVFDSELIKSYIIEED